VPKHFPHTLVLKVPSNLLFGTDMITLTYSYVDKETSFSVGIFEMMIV